MPDCTEIPIFVTRNIETKQKLLIYGHFVFQVQHFITLIINQMYSEIGFCDIEFDKVCTLD